MNSRRNAALAALVLLLAVGGASARSTDRRQPMEVDGGSVVYSTDDSRPTVFTGGVTITQGTLRITAASAEITMRDGKPARAMLRGGVRMSEQLDDGTPMTSSSASADYDMSADVVTLIGSANVQQPRGTLTGDRITYNMKSGQVASGAAAGGGRVHMRILPKGTP